MEWRLTHLCRLWACYKFLCSMFTEDTKLLDCIKHNVIQKLAYDVKYNDQINGAMIQCFSGIWVRSFIK